MSCFSANIGSQFCLSTNLLLISLHQLPQKSRFGHSVVPPPQTPNFQPFVEESDEPPVV